MSGEAVSAMLHFAGSVLVILIGTFLALLYVAPPRPTLIARCVQLPIARLRGANRRVP